MKLSYKKVLKLYDLVQEEHKIVYIYHYLLSLVHAFYQGKLDITGEAIGTGVQYDFKWLTQAFKKLVAGCKAFYK